MSIFGSIFGKKERDDEPIEFIFLRVRTPVGVPFIAVFAAKPLGLLSRNFNTVDAIIREQFGVSATAEVIENDYAVNVINSNQYKVVFMDRLLTT